MKYVFQLGALTLALASPSQAALISYSDDLTNTLVGTFEFDVGTDNGFGQAIANFVHFDLIPGDGTFNTFVTIDLLVDEFRIYGEDDALVGLNIAQESYGPLTGAPFANRSGTFTSGVDGSTIAYSYTDFQFSGLVLEGKFSFTQVPEPSSALLGALALGFLGRRRRS